MSISNRISESNERYLDAVIREYYDLVEAGIEVDHQAFLKRHPGLESEINDFLSNVKLLADGHHLDASRQSPFLSGAMPPVPSAELPTTSNIRPTNAPVQNAIMVRDYRILERIGQGGMGCVYRAMHVHLQKQVALKTIRVERASSSEAIQRFTREMRILAKLEHPNIVQVFDAGEFQDTHYFVMELVAGIDLRKLIDRIGPLPMPEASKIICQAAEALQYAHDQKVLHRDVKPANMMLTAKGSVKLLDLGLAQVLEMQLDDQISRADQFVGTFAYMAPERLVNSQQCNNQSDVYSLGISLHELLSGSRPCHQTGSLPLVVDVRSMRPDLDEQLCQLLDEMISTSPSDRPRSMAEVATRLKDFGKDADLSGLVAEYYHWNKRGTMVPSPAPLRDDTEANAAAKTEPSEFPLDLGTRERKAIRSGSKPILWRALPSFFAGAVTVACVALFLPNESSDVTLPQNPGPIKPPSPIVELGVLEIMNDTDDPLVVSVIDSGKLEARRLGDGGEVVESVSVKEGPNELQSGRYELHIPGPVPYVPIPFTISSSADIKLVPNPVLKSFFQFPVIPDIRCIGVFHGSVWLANWPTKAKTTYDLTLEVLAVDDQATPRTKWLKVEVRSYLESGVYQEIGFLKIDSDEWENARLSILEGWVEASGDSIKQLVDDRLIKPERDTLVVKFDSATDAMKEISSFTLPVGRVSVHDILVLFFGDNHIDAADETILKLRSSLAEKGDRHVWLEPILLDSPLVECYVVSSHSRAAHNSREGTDSDPRWMIARSSQNPFEIVKLDVVTEFLEAHCTTTASRAAITQGVDLRQTLEDLASRAIDPATFPKAYPFDLARIPDEPCSVTIGGTITRSGLTEVIDFTVSMLGTEVIEGRTLHWLELDITSDPAGAGQREIGRLLVDASEYPETLKIEKGWLAFDDGATVLPFQGSDLESIINARLQLSAKPNFQRTGFVDLMSMLFNADFTPSSKLTDLRGHMDRLIGVRSGNAVKLPHKTLGALPCMLYSPLTGGLDQVKYQLYRCNEVPFGFAEIMLSAAGIVDIHLKLDVYRTLTEPFEKSPLGSHAHLANLERATAEQLSKRAKINWRVWTWSDAGKEYKVWAEFGGIVQSKKPMLKEVLLWGEREKECRIPYALFAVPDQNWIDKGRFWQTPSGVKQLAFKGVYSGGFLEVEGYPVKEEILGIEDKNWLSRYKKSKSKTMPGNWVGFAPYIR